MCKLILVIPDLEKLSTTDWAVLAFLLEGETHGFRVAAAFSAKGELGKIWKVQRTQVYRSLEHLLNQGLIQPIRQEPGETGPPRTLFAATDLGVEAARGWLQTPVTRLRMGRSDLRLKLAFLARLDLDPQPLIQQQRQVFVKLLLELGQLQPASQIDRITLLWRTEMAQASLRFLDQLLKG